LGAIPLSNLRAKLETKLPAASADDDRTPRGGPRYLLPPLALPAQGEECQEKTEQRIIAADV